MDSEIKDISRLGKVREMLNKKLFGGVKVKVFLGVIIGTVAGFLYYHFWGCTNGCSIKSNPWTMMAFGFIIGGLLASDLK